MNKHIWIAIVSLLILTATAAQAQWRITTTNGDEYVGVFISDDKDSLSLRTLDNIDIRICQDNIKITEKMKTKVETKSKDVFIGLVNNINEKELTLLTDGAGETIIPLSSVFKLTVVSNDVSDYYSPANYKVPVESEPEINNESVPETKNEPELEIEGGYPMFGVICGLPSIVGVVLGFQSENGGIRVDGIVLDDFMTFRLNFLMNISKDKNSEQNLSIGGGLLRLSTSIVQIPYGGVWLDLNNGGFFIEAGAICLESDDDFSVLPSLQIGYVHRFID